MLQNQASNGTNECELNQQKRKIFNFPETLKTLGTIDKLPDFRFRWNSNEVGQKQFCWVFCSEAKRLLSRIFELLSLVIEDSLFMNDKLLTKTLLTFEYYNHEYVQMH